MKIHEIREQRAAKVAEMRAVLAAAETQGRQLTPEEVKAFDDVKAIITALDSQEARAAFIEEAERRSMGQTVDKPLADLESRISLVDAINCQVEQRSATGALAEYAKEHERRTGQKAQGIAVPMSLFEQRAAQTTTTAAGIVPDDFRADQFVGLLRNAMVVKSLGARVLPGLRGDVTIPRQKAASTAYWLAEGDTLTDSGLTFDSVGLKPRHVGAITELSRQLLQQSNPAIEQLVRDDFINVVSLAVDKAMLHGDGVKQPRGLINRTGANGSVQVASLGAPDWNGWHEILEKLALLNIAPNAVLTHPAVATVLRTARKDASNPLAGYLLEGNTLTELPVMSTNQLEAKSEILGRILIGDFSEMVIGTWGGIDVMVNPFAEGPYSRGAVQVRILTTMDMVPRRDEAFVLVDNVVI